MVLVTATTRLSRELRQDYDRKQAAAGLSSWPTAQILPLSAWLSELWTGWLYSRPNRPVPRLLRPAEERVIWEGIVRSGAENLLLEVSATAEAALDAWNLLCAWALPLDAPEWRDSADSETFHMWATVFSRRCREKGWLSGADLPAFVANLVEEGAIPIPEEVEVAGFFEPTPVQQRVFDSLRSHGVELRERNLPDFTSEGVRLGLVDRNREIRAAAEWARHILESDPTRPSQSSGSASSFPTSAHAAARSSVFLPKPSIPAAACGPTWIRGDSSTSLSDYLSANTQSSRQRYWSSALILRRCHSRSRANCCDPLSFMVLRRN